MSARDLDNFIDDSEYETDASSGSGKMNGDDGDDEVQVHASGSEDEWRPRWRPGRRTRRAAAEKKYGLLLNSYILFYF